VLRDQCQDLFGAIPGLCIGDAAGGARRSPDAFAIGSKQDAKTITCRATAPIIIPQISDPEVGNRAGALALLLRYCSGTAQVLRTIMICKWDVPQTQTLKT
jgi:hypothetical protein